MDPIAAAALVSQALRFANGILDAIEQADGPPLTAEQMAGVQAEKKTTDDRLAALEAKAASNLAAGE